MESNGSSNGAHGASTGHGPALPVGKVFELFVFKPMGAALGLFGHVVAKGCSTLTEGPARIRQAEAKVRQARTIGQFAVTIGTRVVRKEVDNRLGAVLRRAGHHPEASAPAPATTAPAPRTEPEGEAQATARHTAARATAAPSAPPAPAAPEKPAEKPAAKPAEKPAEKPVESQAAAPAAGELPIPAYDGLSASQVVQRLSGLSGDELAAVRAYEAAGRARKTVLAAVDRLTR